MRLRRAATWSSLVGAAVLAIAVDSSARDAAETDECIRAAEDAQPLRAAGRLRAAREKLVVCARETCPTTVRTDCTEWLLDVDRTCPSIVIRAVTAEGKDLVDVRVTIDDAIMTDHLDGTPIAVDPGVHSVRFDRVGVAAIQEKLVIRQGEQNRLVSVTFPSSPRPSVERPGIPTASWALTGVGAAALAGAVFFWVSGRAERADLSASCAPTHSCAPSDVDHARSKLIVGDVFLGVGLLALGAAAWIWISSTRTATGRDLAVDGLRF